MSSTVFALLLFGCADDGSGCQQLAARPKYYDSQVMCEADVDMALQSDVSLSADYPTIVAKCVQMREVAAAENRAVELRSDPKLASR